MPTACRSRAAGKKLTSRCPARGTQQEHLFMTVRDVNDREIHNRDARRTDVDRVDAVRGTPTDRVRWGPILAGTFAALTTLAILSTLGAAIGFSSYDRGQDDVRN